MHTYFLCYHILEGLLRLMRCDQPPWFSRDAVKLCFSFIIQDYGNNTCIIHSVKLPFIEAMLQPAPGGTRMLKMLSVREQVKQILGPLSPYKPQLVAITLIKSIQSLCKEGDVAFLSLVWPFCG